MDDEQQLQVQDGAIDRSWQLSYLAASWLKQPLERLVAQGFSHCEEEGEQFLSYQGQRHGLCQSYYPDGALLSRSYYYHGRLHGPVRYFSQTMQTLSISYYIDGKKCGPSLLWYPSQALYSEQHFVDGQRHGPALYYFENGQLKASMRYCLDKLEGVQEQFYPDGRLRRYSEFQEGLRHGKDEMFDSQGLPLLQANFERAEPVGELKAYHWGGLLADHYTYLGPAWRFHLRRFDKQSRLRLQIICRDGSCLEQSRFDEQGELIACELHHKDSQGQTVKVEVVYKDGKRTGAPPRAPPGATLV